MVLFIVGAACKNGYNFNEKAGDDLACPTAGFLLNCQLIPLMNISKEKHYTEVAALIML